MPIHRTFCRRGFTLVELLTVIAIIGVLIAIIIPVVSQVKASARTSKCAGKVRQLVVGTMTYANDHRGVAPFPFGTVAAPSYSRAPHFYSVAAYNATLSGYVGDRFDSLYCPGRLSEDPNYDPEVQRTATTPNDFVSYQYFNRDRSGTASGRPKAEYNLLFANIRHAPADHAMWGCLAYKSGKTVLGHAEGRSSGDSFKGMNAGYADGSVRWVGYDDLETFSDDKAYRWPKPPGS